MPIHFGTDGWRAVISDTFTFSNLRLVTQAICDALHAELGEQGNGNKEHKIVVGFDTRFLSDRYAADVSRVFAANGFHVYLSQADSPTPAISYAITNLGAVGGVMITASHNPPRYNGIKLKAAYGGSVPREQARRVEIYLNDNEIQGRGPNQMDYSVARERGLIKKFNPIPDYYDHLRTLIDFDTIAENPQRVVIDSMFGSGRGAIKGILQGTGCEVHEIRGNMNPGFDGSHPEPIGKYLGPLAGAIAQGFGSLGLATDGDGDRIGAMDERGNFVDPHKIMALAVRHLSDVRGLSGAVVRTVSTTRMIDRLGEKYGFKVYETPVGFNHIAKLMMTEDVLLGGEESGGISFKGHIPEGDGVLMGLLIIEIVATANKSLYELVEDLLKEVGPAHYARTDLRLKRPVEKSVMTAKLAEEAPKEIGGEEVVEVATTDGCKYILADDSWLLIRPSGTEPVLRVYAEGRSEEMVEALLAYGETVATSVS